MWRYAIPAVVFLVIAGFFYRGLNLSPAYLDSPLVGKRAPEFSLPSVRDPSIEVGTANFGGELVLLNVWGTWCAECRYEHDMLLEIAASGISIYGLNWNDERPKAIAWLDTLGDPYVASAFDDIGDVAIDYGVYGAPETFLIAPDLTILLKETGELSRQDWETRFVPLIEAYRKGG